ncbi:MAG: phosphoadenylyl-sulfate reductase [Chthoniobacterales bacterium]|nr:phosphoadenylyl-sulfate reductase [Chthoniobacterales bacterium]
MLKREEINWDEIREVGNQLEQLEVCEILRWCWQKYGKRAAIGTSFQGGGLVVLNEAMENGLDFPVFTIDTGLLFSESLELKKKLEERYGIIIESLFPELSIEDQAKEFGPELWKRNPDLCCTLRKVIPLQKKLTQLDVWITGLRRQQSESRTKIKVLEIYKFDVIYDRYFIKLNPVAGWSRDQVRDYLKKWEIPTNPLLEKGYRSIGCMPCTRPIAEGENERAGRWTGFDKSECGIHTFLGANI